MTHKIELELRKFVAPEFVFGTNARFLAGRYVRNLGARKVLVVTDRGILEAGWVSDVIGSLEDEGIAYSVFPDVTPNPRSHEVTAGAERYRTERCEAILAVGGGSPTDCAKGIGIVSANGGDILEYEGADKVSFPLPPLVCVPTTSGSSADVSQFAIITDVPRKVKIAIVSKMVVPDVALIDPVTTTSMDRELTAHTGLDAFSHAVESFASNAHSPITDTHALEAIRFICDALGSVVDHLDDLQLRGGMMLGSLFAGLAFSNASLGAVHAMAHSLGGLLDLPHGECNAILLEHVVGYNFDATPGRYRRLAAAMGTETCDLSDADAREALVGRIAGLRRSVGVDVTLGALGMRREDITELAANAMNDPCLITNPRKVTQADIEKVYERAI